MMQVCLNSAKVRLNSGILERRHSNWRKALDHFRSARQIDDTYCEPSYWIGATLLQEGRHIKQALQVYLSGSHRFGCAAHTCLHLLVAHASS